MKKENQRLVNKLEEKENAIEDLQQKANALTKENEDKSRSIKDLSEKIQAWERVVASQHPGRIGCYSKNKSIYDSLRTRLTLSNCILDVSLEARKKEGTTYYLLHFKWKLVIFNESQSPASSATFVYSGDEKYDISPDVTVDDTPTRLVSKNIPNAVGDDCFKEILFPNELKPDTSVTVIISYTLPTYKFNEKYDYVWLVPDALGFKDVSSFRIRFFLDDEVVKDTTRAILRIYQLDSKYQKEGDDKLVKIEGYKDGKKAFSEPCTDSKIIKNHGFLLILNNLESELPEYLKNV